MLTSITHDDVDLYYQRTGTGPTITFLHGFSGNHLSWWQQIPFFNDEYQCIATDQRMFGRSTDKENGPGAKNVVDDLTAILDHESIDQTVLVGHSMSGWTVTSFATQYPDRVTALVLSGTPGGLIDRERHQHIRDEHENALPDVTSLSPPTAFLSESITELNQHAPPEFDEIHPILDDLPIDAQTIQNAAFPVLIIAGEADQFMPRAGIKAVKEHIPKAQSAIIHDAGHSTNEEKPTVFNQYLRNFLEQPDKETPS